MDHTYGARGEMTFNLYITSVRDGTVNQTIQLAIRESGTGTMEFLFGKHIPLARIYFTSGTIVSAVFGDLRGAAVFDLLICQEYAVKAIRFVSGDVQTPFDADFSENPLMVLHNAGRDVEQCAARPLIYGLQPLQLYDGREVESLLHVMHDFSHYSEFLERLTPSDNDRDAPLAQCRLLHRALSRDAIQYKTPLVALKSFRSLLELVQPLEEREAENLRVYMRSLLPHPRATHMPLERFYAFASAVESLAYRRGEEFGEESRRIIYRMIQTTTMGDDNDDGLSPARVPARGPRPGSEFGQTTPRAKPRNDAQPADDRDWRQVIKDGLAQHYEREPEE